MHEGGNSTCSTYHLYSNKDEKIDSLVSGCSKILQADWKQWHDQIVKFLIANFSRGLNLNVARTTRTIKLRWFWKTSGLKSYGTLISKHRHLAYNMPAIRVIKKKNWCWSSLMLLFQVMLGLRKNNGKTLQNTGVTGWNWTFMGEKCSYSNCDWSSDTYGTFSIFTDLNILIFTKHHPNWSCLYY